MPGPVPKRSDERVRRNKPDIPLKIGQAKVTKRPPEDRAWHPVAKRLYRSIKGSGQADFYQETDWEYARFTMGQISDALKNADGRPLRAGLLSEINKMMQELMFTEPARRRAHVELKNTVESSQDKVDATIYELRRGIH